MLRTLALEFHCQVNDLHGAQRMFTSIPFSTRTQNYFKRVIPLRYVFSNFKKKGKSLNAILFDLRKIIFFQLELHHRELRHRHRK